LLIIVKYDIISSKAIVIVATWYIMCFANTLFPEWVADARVHPEVLEPHYRTAEGVGWELVDQDLYECSHACATWPADSETISETKWQGHIL